VFVDGWTLEAAETVCAGDGIDQPDVLNLLGSLSTKSLLIADVRTSETRYRLLETVQQYAWDRLIESGSAADARRRHRDCYLALAERRAPEHPTKGYKWMVRPEWLDLLEREHGNLRAALQWSAGESEGADAELRLVAALGRFWDVRGYFAEGRHWLDHALSRPAGSPWRVRKIAILGAAVLAARQGDLSLARERTRVLLAKSRAVGDMPMVFDALLIHGMTLCEDEHYEPAAAVFEDALAVATDLKDDWRKAEILGEVGGSVAHGQGNDNLAVQRIEDSVTLFERLGHHAMAGYSRRSLGHVLRDRGDAERAADLYAESLRRFRSGLGVTFAAVECVEGLAAVAVARGQCERAARLFGAADGFRRTLGFPRRSFDRPRHDARVAAARTAVGPARFDAAFEDGRRMSLAEAVEYALVVAESGKPDAHASAKAPRDGPLTPREREVAGLIARGQTNREIAASLVISERTADAHVQNILNKLGFATRAQIAAWVAERGL